MTDLATLSEGTLQGWLRQIDSRVVAIQLQLEPLLLEQRQLREQRKLLEELLASVQGTLPAEGADGRGEVSATPAKSAAPVRRESVRERVHREVVAVLRECGRPLHINDLLDEYVNRGYKVPGQGKGANLSVHLSGWTDIASPERGVYALVAEASTSNGAQ